MGIGTLFIGNDSSEKLTPKFGIENFLSLVVCCGVGGGGVIDTPIGIKNRNY
jgi:hypothetical protein